MTKKTISAKKNYRKGTKYRTLGKCNEWALTVDRDAKTGTSTIYVAHDNGSFWTFKLPDEVLLLARASLNFVLRKPVKRKKK